MEASESSSSERFSVQDPSTRSNYREAAVKHYHWLVKVDFPAQVLHCSLRLTGTVLKDSCSQLVLDMCGLKVSSVVDTGSGRALEFETSSPEGAFGSVLTISSQPMKEGTEFNVTIKYETTPSCSAVQWLKCEQTAGKKHPYLYTQCQPIHARSMLPCMDTPSIKTTYTAEVTVPGDLTALMSAEGKGSEVHASEPDKKVFKFEQKVPIPSYLMALVVGALESRRVGPRSQVWCEKEMIDQAEWQFSETDKILCTAEELAGPYVWGVYDLLILPPSFPYGGMENPCLTFLSSTVLSANTEEGDKSSASRLVAHECSHSWTGNLVTNVSWEHFWLNEGWTTYLERKIIAKLYGEKERHLMYISGWKNLGDDVEHFKTNNQLPLTAMVPHLSGVHPDDAFSRVPYEKGSMFLFYLESLLGGPGSMDAFIKHYLASHKYANIDSESWKNYFLGFFKQKATQGLLAEVDWKKWYYGQGLPPYTPKYDTSLADISEALAEKWLSITEVTAKTMAQFSSQDLSDMSSTCQREFLNRLLLKTPMAVEVLEGMDVVYQMSKRQDSELKYRWQQLCLKSGHTKIFPQVVDFITKQGRMKYVRPLYRGLFDCGEQGKSLALQTFAAHRSFYHSVAAQQLEKDLKLRPVP